MNIKPRPLQYLIRLSKPATETAGGIALPEISQSNETEGEVVAVGVGRLPGGEACSMEAAVEDVVIFRRDDFKLMEGDLGFVHEEDLVAIRDGEEVEPANDWVLIKPDPRPVESAGGIAIPQKYQRRGKSGRIENYGPGRLIRKGEFTGTRLPSDHILGLEYPILDSRAYWSREARTVTISGEAGRWVCVRAGDLVALEGD
jgi:co-chaperonin GroES (HSP10)